MNGKTMDKSSRTRLVTAEYQLKQQRIKYYKARRAQSWRDFAEMNSLNLVALGIFLLFAGILTVKHWDKRREKHGKNITYINTKAESHPRP